MCSELWHPPRPQAALAGLAKPLLGKLAKLAPSSGRAACALRRLIEAAPDKVLAACYGARARATVCFRAW